MISTEDGDAGCTRVENTVQLKPRVIFDDDDDDGDGDDDEGVTVSVLYKSKIGEPIFLQNMKTKEYIQKSFN